MFISLSAAPTKVWAYAILRRLSTGRYLRIPHKSKGFILLPRQSTFFALSQAEGGAGLGSESGDLPAGLNSANYQCRKGANYLSLKPWFPQPPEKWAVLLDDLLSSPMLKFWNLIFSSL